ncbi:hypothetical protein PTKIN_Ptkin02bG0201000 [Pterospermum kingtungense]
MDVEDDTRESSVSSAIIGSLESARNGDKLSDEDLAWVNSCLVTDTEILESDWSSFKDVLLEIVGDKPESLHSSATGSDVFAGGTEIKIVPSIEEAEAGNYSGGADEDLVVISVNGDTETKTNGIPNKRRPHVLSQFSQEDSPVTFQGDPFLPTYTEDDRQDDAIDLGLQLSFSADETNSSTVDIFRVWDLDIPAEEDDLIKQLNKAIADTETSYQSMPPAFDDSTAWKDLKDEPLDSLIAGIADLSLNTKSFS